MIDRFERAAEAAMKDDRFDAITSLLGSEMDNHGPISGVVSVHDLRKRLDDEQMEALGIKNAPDSAVIVGYNATGGFRLRTAKEVEV